MSNSGGGDFRHRGRLSMSSLKSNTMNPYGNTIGSGGGEFRHQGRLSTSSLKRQTTNPYRNSMCVSTCIYGCHLCIADVIFFYIQMKDIKAITLC